MARRKRKSYSKEFKEDAVRLVLEQGYSCREAANDLGLHSTLISRWVREMTAEQPKQPTRKEPMDKDARIRELERENLKLKMERDLLKKAATFFSNESK